MRRAMILLLACAQLLVCAACAEKKDGKTDKDADATPVRRIGVAIYDYQDSFMALYGDEIVSYFGSLSNESVRYEITVVDSRFDQMVQKKAVEGFIAQGVDAIILNLVTPSSAESIIDRVVSAKIPLVLINREPVGTGEGYPGIVNNPLVCYVGADARQSGTFQGEIIRDLPNHGDVNGDGKVGYLMIEGDVENTDAQYRTQYSVKALTDAGIAVEELDSGIGDWKRERGQEIAAIALARYGDAIEVVFSNNDSMALGAAVSIAGAERTVGKDIYLVGVDALEECVSMVREGTMTGTVRNDYVGQSHKAVDVAIAAMSGEAIENYYWVDYVKITNE